MVMEIECLGMRERQPSDDEIARVYENGEHVATLVSERLFHEFEESPTYDVERVEERMEAIL